MTSPTPPTPPIPPTRRTARFRGLLSTRGRAFVASGLTLLVGGLLLGFTDVTRVGVLLCALPLLAGLGASRKASTLAVTRTVHPARLTVGQSASVALVLQNISGRRSRPQLAEEHTHGLGDRPRFILPAMGPDETREVSYQISCQARGRHRLGPMTLRRQDPYGLATITASLPESTDILILPRVEILGRGRPRASGIGAEGPIPHMVALHGEDDVAVRSYRDGDDLRRIHWPSTARRSELMVRQEDHPAMRRAVIILDSRTVAHRRPGSPGTATLASFEWAVSAAASIAAHLSEQHYTLHLASSETVTTGHSSQTVELDDALAWLAVAQLGPSQQLDHVLSWAHPLTSTGGLVIAIVTDHDEAMLRQTAALRRPEGNGLMILLDTDSFAGPDHRPPLDPSDRTLALAEMAVAAGWSTCIAGSRTTVAQAWDTLSAHSQIMVGSGGSGR